MKNFIMILYVLGMGEIAFAQTNTFPSSGNAGVGISSPSFPLEVKNQNGPHTLLGGFYISGTTSAQGGDNNIISTGGYYNGTDLTVTKTRYAAYQQYEGSHYFYGTNNLTPGVSSTAPIRMRIDGVGNVGIGTTSPTEKLSVNGKIRAKEIKVETGWSDFVFEPDYKLPDLKETEQFIKENKHLPEIPSAKEVADNGINLEMNSKLLQKIEELILYVIELKKANESQQKEINLLKSKP